MVFEFILPGGIATISILSVSKFIGYLYQRKWLKALDLVKTKINKKYLKKYKKYEKALLDLIKTEISRKLQWIREQKDRFDRLK